MENIAHAPKDCCCPGPQGHISSKLKNKKHMCSVSPTRCFQLVPMGTKTLLTGETEVSGAQHAPIFSCEVPAFLPFQVITEVLGEQMQGRLELTTSWCGFCCSEKHAILVY
jgi:hypothetical protein